MTKIQNKSYETTKLPKTEEMPELVYETLCDYLIPEYRLPWVENLFLPGQPCYENYSAVSAAYERLRERLGVKNEDVDVEVIINSLLATEHIVAQKMFEYGRVYEKMQSKQ